MPRMVPVFEDDLIPQGEYSSHIVKIDEPIPSIFDPTKKSVRIWFEIADGNYAGQRLPKWYTAIISSRSSLGSLFVRLKGDIPKKKTVDLDDLFGNSCVIIVSHKDGDTGKYAVIHDVFKEKLTVSANLLNKSTTEEVNEP